MTSILANVSASAAHAGTQWVNLAPDSEDLTHAGWNNTQTNILSETKDIGGIACQACAATAVAGTHVVQESTPSLTLTADDLYISAFVASGAQTFVSLKVTVITGIGQTWGGQQWFDLGGGTVETFIAATHGGSINSVGIEEVAGGYRVWMSVACGGDESFGGSWSVFLSEADTDDEFSGDGSTVDLYIGGVSFIDAPTGDAGYVAT